jgi:hypothetical protein
MRHEFKYRLNYLDYAVLASRLRAVLPRDAHTGPDGKYRVRSLYFDTPGDRALREKIDGTDRREKFRIRRYPGMDAAPQRIMLEKKVKIHGLCRKTAAPLTEDECRRIIAGDVEWMAFGAHPLNTELYSKMRGQALLPKTIIEYVREPFVCAAGNVRVTFDTEIRTGIRSTDFLDDAMPLAPAGEEIVLLEVKYDAYIPGYIEDLLQVGSRRAAACSKYALGRVYG